MRSLLFLCLLLGSAHSYALDRFKVEGYLLPNGLQVLLKPGEERRHVSIRLVVGVGFDDFPCADKELPHLLEHLLFSGLDGKDEGDLETRMQALGGEWNAFTSDSDTTFVIEAPARNERKVLDLLLATVTRTRIDDAALERARQIVEREDGGHYSHLQRWLDKQDVGRPASDQLAVELGIKCAERASAAALTLDQVRRVRDQWYAPNNMTLIMVGGLDKFLPAYLQRVWGELQAVDPTEHVQDSPKPQVAEGRRDITRGWLGDSARLHWYFLEPALEPSQAPALDLLQSYIEWSLYEDLRLQHGLSYGPTVQRESYGDTGLFSLNADLDRDQIDAAEATVENLLQRLHSDGLDASTFARLKQAAIDRQLWAVQGNSGTADYYWTALSDYDGKGFTDPARAFARIDLDEANAVLRKLLDQPLYVRIERPMLSFDDLNYIAGIAAVLLVGVGYLLLRRRYR